METVYNKLSNRRNNMIGKVESVKEAAKAIGHPYTSLYIPIRIMDRAGLLRLEKGKGNIKYLSDNPYLHNQLKASEIF